MLRILLATAWFSAAWACSGESASTQPPTAGAESAGQPEITAEQYRRFKQEEGRRLEADMETWAKQEFSSRAEATEQLARLDPGGDISLERDRAILREMGIQPEQVARFVASNQAVAIREGNALTARLRALNQRLAPRFRQLEQLPEGKPTAGPPPPPGWTTVTSFEELRSHALRAAASRQPVIIHFNAAWATPCAALVELYAQDPVAARLAPYLRLFVDVTAGIEATERIRDALDVPFLPDVQVFRDPGPLAAYLRGDGERPAPSVRFPRVVDAATFVQELGLHDE